LISNSKAGRQCSTPLRRSRERVRQAGSLDRTRNGIPHTPERAALRQRERSTRRQAALRPTMRLGPTPLASRNPNVTSAASANTRCPPHAGSDGLSRDPRVPSIQPIA